MFLILACAESPDFGFPCCLEWVQSPGVASIKNSRFVADDELDDYWQRLCIVCFLTDAVEHDCILADCKDSDLGFYELGSLGPVIPAGWCIEFQSHVC